MKNKLIYTFLIIIVAIFLFISLNSVVPTLGGTYSTKEFINGKLVQISIDTTKNTFVEYINQREVDRGKYSSIKNKENSYAFKSDIQEFEIAISKDNSFDIYLNKINGEEAINLKFSTKIPQYFSGNTEDVNEYKELLK